MAILTAEDVLNKAFSKTKYREGFDQDEVDDFLDEVAHTITSLIAERDDLAGKLQQAHAGGAPQAVEAAPLTEAGGVPGTSGLLGAATDPNPPSPAGMLAMAQKLHDEYVHAGEEERERIVDEAKTKAEGIVEQAQTDAKSRMDDLASERSDLERKIDDLRRFERDYRARLKTFLENLLGDLDHGSSSASALAAAAVVGSSDDDSHEQSAPLASGIEWPAGDAEGDHESSGEPSQEDTPAAEDEVENSAAQSDDSTRHSESAPEADFSAPAVNEPPVRESFGYRPQTPAPEADENDASRNEPSARAENSFGGGHPFAPVTHQTPIVRSGDARGDDGSAGTQFPSRF